MVTLVFGNTCYFVGFVCYCEFTVHSTFSFFVCPEFYTYRSVMVVVYVTIIVRGSLHYKLEYYFGFIIEHLTFE